MRRLSLFPAVLLFAAIASAPVHAQTPGNLPYVTSITFLPSPPCDSIPTRMVIAGYFPTQCGSVLGHDGTTIFVSEPVPPCVRCEQGPKAWADTLDLGLLAAGSHMVTLTIGVVDPCDSLGGDTTFSSAQVAFQVGTECPTPPPSIDPMNYVTSVKITSTRDTTSTTICEGDSILLRVGGVFPNDCYQLRGIELLPSPATVVPVPLTVRLVFDNMCCAERLCIPSWTQWEGSIVIPPVHPGGQNLTMVGYETCCSDEPAPNDPVGYRYHGFKVWSSDSCGITPPPVTCIWPTWLHDQTAECDAFLSEDGRTAQVTGMVHTTVALAGIQGEVHAFSPSGIPLHVQSMETTGLAAGMHLTWENTPHGAKFVMFAPHGAPLPPTSPRRPSQFLKIRWFVPVRSGERIEIDPSTRWHVAWNDVFGSDIDGKLVPLCPLGTPGIFADAATICMGALSACDMNGDAQADVRDLVLMSHCLYSPPLCPFGIASLDCDGDLDSDFDDLYCCARTVLGIPPCPGCGDSIRVEPGIAVSFGAPQRGADAIGIPIRIDGVGRLGAARLTLTMPPGLAEGATVEVQNASNWLKVTRVLDGRLEIGLIEIPSAAPGAPSFLDAMLRVTVPPGSQPDGQIALENADLSGPDGVKLRADLGTPVVRLGPGLGVSLSAARPNPFSTSTTFRITLDAAVDAAEVGVYDLSGRRVSTLHKGALPIGSHPFTWNGRVDGGGQAKAGVYFVRATAGGKTTNQKLVMLKQ